MDVSLLLPKLCTLCPGLRRSRSSRELVAKLCAVQRGVKPSLLWGGCVATSSQLQALVTWVDDASRGHACSGTSNSEIHEKRDTSSQERDKSVEYIPVSSTGGFQKSVAAETKYDRSQVIKGDRRCSEEPMHSLGQASFCILTLGQDLLVLNVPVVLDHLMHLSERTVFIDISSASLLPHKEAVMRMEPMFSQLRLQLQRAKGGIFALDLCDTEDANLCSLFGVLLCYPCIYTFCTDQELAGSSEVLCTALTCDYPGIHKPLQLTSFSVPVSLKESVYIFIEAWKERQCLKGKFWPHQLDVTESQIFLQSLVL